MNIPNITKIKTALKKIRKPLGIAVGIMLITGSLMYAFWYNLSSFGVDSKESTRQSQSVQSSSKTVYKNTRTNNNINIFSSKLKEKNDIKYILIIVALIGTFVLISSIISKNKSK